MWLCFFEGEDFLEFFCNGLFLCMWNVVCVILVIILEVIVLFVGIDFEEVEFSSEIIDVEISIEVGISDFLGL